ncbi:MAG: hypothetical protein OEV66_12420 [Spirochaetia bacterium]|nr:hypothetical protein [Spirochaetia bacterium]
MVFIPACGNDCAKYKKTACANPDSSYCHEAMQKIPEMSLKDCEEKLSNPAPDFPRDGE